MVTLRRDHVRVLPADTGGDEDRVRFRCPATSGQVRDVVVADTEVARLVRRPGRCMTVGPRGVSAVDA